MVFVDTYKKVEFGLVYSSLVWPSQIWFGLVEFGLVWSSHGQINKLNDYLVLIILICEFVCGFCGQTIKEEEI